MRDETVAGQMRLLSAIVVRVRLVLKNCDLLLDQCRRSCGRCGDLLWFLCKDKMGFDGRYRSAFAVDVISSYVNLGLDPVSCPNRV